MASTTLSSTNNSAANSSPAYFVGLMSGTSLDGVDAALIDAAQGCRLLHHAYTEYPAALRQELLALNGSGADELARSATASIALSRAYAGAVSELLGQARVSPREVRAIGCHGQTVRHQPQSGYTIQLMNGAWLAELSGITVACDFRSRDIAAGGQGAPLVPAFHAAMLRDPVEHRVVLNIGGIANVTNLPPAGPVTGFDTGPGNALLDGWAEQHLGTRFDAGGAWAMTGTVVSDLLRQLLQHPYFGAPPPKSTGRELVNLGWVENQLNGSEAPQDVQRTLLEVTATSIARAVKHYCNDSEAVYVCGGGVHNSALMGLLARELVEQRVASTSALGIDPDWMEAIAFAWLASRTLAHLPGNEPSVTGAQGPRVLGAIYPA